MTDTRKNILVSAYACSPYKGSEPGVGWGFISELCKYHNLHIIVEEEKFKHEITEWLLRNNESDVAKYGKFYFIKKKGIDYYERSGPLHIIIIENGIKMLCAYRLT